ncbi:unnamed protein product [Meloidogyne enterolobii]|uniref:Uncharacterized protein n=1 Tax=Meloidogyne enterolobii TaxID=390850 RepID=A0ACB0XTZ2_MELEN
MTMNKNKTYSELSTSHSAGNDDINMTGSLQSEKKKIRRSKEAKNKKIPIVDVQEKLIEYYEKEDPTFKIAKKLVDDAKDRSNILDRLAGDELKVLFK